MAPDPWQAEILSSDADRILLTCSRQMGKSETAAALAVWTAVVQAPALVLIASPTQRQSAELLRKVKALHGCLLGERPEAGAWRPARARERRRRDIELAAGEDLVQESALKMEMRNGSRIVALPGKEATIRSFSAVKLLVIDEAARTPDALYNSVRPMLAVSRGRLIALSSAWAKQGWFWEAFDGKGDWHRVRNTCWECPRLSPEWLQEGREDIGPRWFSLEYEAVFGDAADALFTEADVRAALACDAEPLFPNLA